MSIILTVADYCHDCDEFKAEVEKHSVHVGTWYAPSSETMTQTEVHCAHQNRCAAICRHIENKLERG